MSTVDCPYYHREYKKCELYGTNKDESERNLYCQTSDNWQHCSNYTSKSYEEKRQKKIRSDPNL